MKALDSFQTEYTGWVEIFFGTGFLNVCEMFFFFIELPFWNFSLTTDSHKFFTHTQQNWSKLTETKWPQRLSSSLSASSLSSLPHLGKHLLVASGQSSTLFDYRFFAKTTTMPLKREIRWIHKTESRFLFNLLSIILIEFATKLISGNLSLYCRKWTFFMLKREEREIKLDSSDFSRALFSCVRKKTEFKSLPAFAYLLYHWYFLCNTSKMAYTWFDSDIGNQKKKQRKKLINKSFWFPV